MALDRNDLDVASMPLPANIGPDSLSCHEHRSAGRLTFSPHAYAPAGVGDYFSNIFHVVGLVDLKALYGQFTAAGNTATGPAHVYLAIDDGAAAVNLTDGTPGAGGTDMTNAIVGASVLKNAALAVVATYLAAGQCRTAELTIGGSARPFFNVLLQAKPTVTTNYIRFMYSVTGAAAFSISWVAIWSCRFPGSYIEAV